MKILDLLKKFNYTCYYCHRKIDETEATRDHFDPNLKPVYLKKSGKKRRGGGRGYGRNIVLACRYCNLSKGNMNPAEFMKGQNFFIRKSY